MTDRLNLVNPDHIHKFLNMVFGYVDWEDTEFATVRGQGEPGTDAANRSIPELVQPSFIDLKKYVTGAAQRYADNQVACFMLPGVLSEANGKEESVKFLTCVCCDIDTGNPAEKLDFLNSHLGSPTMVVESGGTTKEGFPKYHVYWRLTEPREPKNVAHVRHLIAAKVGGDPSFDRLTQVIRVPGTAYQKNGVELQSKIILNVENEFDLDELALLVDDMPQMEGIEERESFNYAEPTSNMEKVLLEPIHEGGEGDTRWSRFSSVAGHYVRMTREGHLTAQEALSAVDGWVQANMVPPWEPTRIEKEFQGILNKDIGSNGPMPKPAVKMIDAEEGILKHAVYKWAEGPVPERKWLVQGLIPVGKPVLLAAEGGAGKSFLMLDLALKVASGDQDTLWMGQRVNHQHSGTIVMLTAEDDADELKIRLHGIDSDQRAKRGGDKLLVIPLPDHGGAFPIVTYKNGEPKASDRWRELTKELSKIEDLSLVIIDTFNATMHGEENSATTVQEYMREASIMCGSIGAALLVTHHIRKGDSQNPIRNLEDMQNAIRGSSALPSAFRIVIGVWHATDYKRRLESMQIKVKPKMLYKGGVCKANNNECLDGEITLLRAESGLLEDVSTRDPFHGTNKYGDQPLAWMLVAIRAAAKSGYPYTTTGPKGVYKRRDELPGALDGYQRSELERIVQDLRDVKRVVQADYLGAGKNLLDVPDGPIATAKPGHERPEAGAYNTPDWGQFAYNSVSDEVMFVVGE